MNMTASIAESHPPPTTKTEIVLEQGVIDVLIGFSRFARNRPLGAQLGATLPHDHPFFPGSWATIAPLYGDRNANGKGFVVRIRAEPPLGSGKPGFEADVEHLGLVGGIDMNGNPLEANGRSCLLLVRGDAKNDDPAHALSILSLLPGQVDYGPLPVVRGNAL